MKKILFFLFIIFFLTPISVVYAYGDCSGYGLMAYYDSLSGGCKCMSGYVWGKDFLGNDSCVSCSSKYGYGATADYLSGGCKCMSGYIMKRGFLGKLECVSADQECRDEYGVMSRYNSLYEKCECSFGYLFGKDSIGRTQCISEDEACKNQYGFHARSSFGGKCKCSYGYAFSKNSVGKTECIDTDSICQDKYGYNSEYDTLSDECECRSGYELSLKSSGGLECESCSSKYGYHSSYDYLSKECECDDGYTLDDNNQCVEKQNNVYFSLEVLDTNDNKAIVKSDYDYREYLIEYGVGCLSIERYVGNKIVINLGTDFNLDTWDKIVLQNNDQTCNITYKEYTFGDSSLCDSGYTLKNNSCEKIVQQQAQVQNIPKTENISLEKSSQVTADIKNEEESTTPETQVQPQTQNQEQTETKNEPSLVKKVFSGVWNFFKSIFKF